MFYSILYPEETLEFKLQVSEPDFFRDLNLDQMINTITMGYNLENIKHHFYTSIQDLRTIQYRQEISNDLKNESILQKIQEFSKRIQTIESTMRIIGDGLILPNSWDCNYLQKSKFMESVDTYCSAIHELCLVLNKMPISSQGLISFRTYVLEYERSEEFNKLIKETQILKNNFSKIKYCMLIDSNAISIRTYDEELDHTEQIENLFERFKQTSKKDISKTYTTYRFAEHVDIGILNLIARLFPDEFKQLDIFCDSFRTCFEKKILEFSGEIQFYLSYFNYMNSVKQINLQFCLPTFTTDSGNIFVKDGFDLALAYELNRQNEQVVTNNIEMIESERILVVTGPNQGGKTTYARMFGQLNYIGNLGLPVPASSAKFVQFDRIFTHFYRNENIENLVGSLQDELQRLHIILNQITSKSIIIINEIFSSTSIQDAITMGKKVIDIISDKDSLCVIVTFIDELSVLGGKVVSIASSVKDDNQLEITYKFIKKPSDGLAFAIHLAEKYELTYDQIKSRKSL